MNIKEAIDNGIIFYKDDTLENMLEYVFRDDHVNDDDGTTYSNKIFSPIKIKMFSKEDYELYEKEQASMPNIKNPHMFVFIARDCNVYLGCFNGEVKNDT